jgi:hypothetical protein
VCRPPGRHFPFSHSSFGEKRIITGDAVSWRVIGDELFAVNFGETARTNEATLGASYIFLLPFCDTNPATQNGGPTECTLSSRKCCCLSSARLRWRRSCMQACILASTLQVFRRKCPLDERKTRRREPAPSHLIVRMHPDVRRDLALAGELARASANPACYDCNPIPSAALVRFANAQ